jgi:hypothetical protein
VFLRGRKPWWLKSSSLPFPPRAWPCTPPPPPSQRDTETSNQYDYFSDSSDDGTVLPGFVPLQLSIDKFILNRTSSTPMDDAVRGWS